MVRYIITLLTILILMSAPSLSADLSKGKAAMRRGDYTAALEEFKPLAEQGNSQAQYRLGSMYDFGQGVKKDPSAAAKWYRRAAKKGVMGAQYNLAEMYWHGVGVSKDDTHC